MKKLLVLVIFLCCKFSDLQSQSTGQPAYFRDIPIGLHLQIGFLFVYIVLGLLFFMLFIFSPRQRLNLFFSLYNVALALMILAMQILKNHTYIIVPYTTRVRSHVATPLVVPSASFGIS